MARTSRSSRTQNREIARMVAGVALLAQQQMERIMYGGRDESADVREDNVAVAKEILAAVERHLDEDLLEQLDDFDGAGLAQTLLPFTTPFTAPFGLGWFARRRPSRRAKRSSRLDGVLDDFADDLRDTVRGNYSDEDLELLFEELRKDVKRKQRKREPESSRA